MTPQQVVTLINESPMNRGMDGREWYYTPGNIAASNGEGDVILFQLSAPGLYEFHWLRMQTKGRKAINETLEAIDRVFRDTDCAIMFGLVPVDRRDSKFMARWIGAKSMGVVPTLDGPAEMFIMTREMRHGVS